MHFRTVRVAAPNPQQDIDTFWASHLPHAAAQLSHVLPPSMYSKAAKKHTPKAPKTPKDIARGRSVNKSYQSALKRCEAIVSQIVAECRRTNTKYTDPDFNLDNVVDSLVSLSARPSSNVATEVTKVDSNSPDSLDEASLAGEDNKNTLPDHATTSRPACARRVEWIFDSPQFYVNNEARIRDIRQGAEGDSWFISSLESLCVDAQAPYLIRNIAPPSCRDEKVGVYGFLFYRDGEWISEVVDDKLYIRVPDYDDCIDDRRTVWDATHSELDPEASRKLWKQTYQSNSDALFFASCSNPHETWVPLIEKAFAKAHGDFAAIDGGFQGEGVEDLTGGVTTEIASASVRDEDELWDDIFLNVNRAFLIGAGTRQHRHLDRYQQGRQGIEDHHAYSVLRAVDYQNERLLMVKNPRGKSEWTGPWSDGSKEWTTQALRDLNYTFANEGIFWMPYADFLERFTQVWRTRLFTQEWNVSQTWTTIQVPWLGAYNPTIFEFTIKSPTSTVITLSQLDSRYFGGLTGQYSYNLSFLLHKYKNKEYILRGYSSGGRSAGTEVDLKPGRYEVLMKVEASRDSTQPTIEDIIEQNWISRREKLIRIGRAYDSAHAKSQAKATVKQRTKAVATATKKAAAATKKVDIATKDTATRVPSQDEPWSAPLVVGLKVFCQNTAATIKVYDQNIHRGWSSHRWDLLQKDYNNPIA